MLGYAYRPLTDAESQSADPAAVEQSLIFIGLSGMIDPPRPEVKAAIQEAKEAGIRSLMITGDHKITARAIAERLGIIEPGDEAGAITGQELNELSDQELKDQVAPILGLRAGCP